MRVAALVKGAPDWRLFPLPHSNSNLLYPDQAEALFCLWGLDVETFFGNYF